MESKQFSGNRLALTEKKVIFIGGTSYSGSTFFDLILGNDPAGFSCGEVHAFFYPYRRHHFNPLCGCGSKDCNIWMKVFAGGVRRLYATIFDVLPHIRYIVDSSKNPFWIESQAKELEKTGIEVKHVLIWKKLQDFADSCRKRGHYDWKNTWLDYHRTYATIIPHWRTVPYSELSTSSETLENVCSYLEIPFFLDKYKYWKKCHHLLFGSNSAKIHLYSKESSNFIRIKKNMKTVHRIHTKKTHQSINYQNIKDGRLLAEVDRIMQEDKNLRHLQGLLETRSVNVKEDNEFQNLKTHLMPPELLVKRIEYTAKKIGSRQYAMLGKWLKL